MNRLLPLDPVEALRLPLDLSRMYDGALEPFTDQDDPASRSFAGPTKQQGVNGLSSAEHDTDGAWAIACRDIGLGEAFLGQDPDGLEQG